MNDPTLILICFGVFLISLFKLMNEVTQLQNKKFDEKFDAIRKTKKAIIVRGFFAGEKVVVLDFVKGYSKPVAFLERQHFPDQYKVMLETTGDTSYVLMKDLEPIYEANQEQVSI